MKTLKNDNKVAIINEKEYRIGDKLICNIDGTEHGRKGHILEIASFDPEAFTESKNTRCMMWCHAISGIDDRSLELRREYPEGNYGISFLNLNYYDLLCGEWDR